jgi:hypothetical protein
MPIEPTGAAIEKPKTMPNFVSDLNFTIWDLFVI